MKTQEFHRLLIYYFSGTGNARVAAQWMAEEAELKGVSAQCVDIGSDLADWPIPDHHTLIGFCSPTHGFNMAPLVLKFMASFPANKATGNRFFLLNTRAGMKMGSLFLPGLSGLALLLPALILLLKGYGFQGFRPLDMPSNWISLHPGLKSKVVDSIVHRCKRKCKKYANQLLVHDKVYRGWLDIIQDLLISPAAIGYYLYGRFILAKTFVATDACNNCGRCKKDCPTQAIISIGEKPFWTHRCESCMRCMNHCPSRAIETPHGFVFLSWWLAFSLLPLVLIFNSGLAIWLNQTFGFTLGSGTANVLEYVLGIAVVYLLYRLMQYLMRFSWFNRIISKTSFTHYKWWRRYAGPSKKLV